jgi:hypothetical protein
MADDNTEGKKGYTFVDKRGTDSAPADDRQAGAGLGAGPEPAAQKAGDRARPSDGPRAAERGLPIDFATLVMSLASAAMMSMGRMADPATGTVQKNLAVAQQNIDIIALLKEKTRGNLTAEEERIVEQVLYELRLTYVEALKER